MKEQEALAHIRDLWDRDRSKRLHAITVLSINRDRRAFGPFARRLFDVDPCVRERAADGLHAMGCGDGPDIVLEMYDARDDAKLVSELLVELRDALQEDLVPRDDDRVPHSALIIVGQARLHSLLPSLVPLASSSNVFVRRAVAEALWLLGGQSVIPLALAMSTDLDPIVRRYCTYALADAEEFCVADDLTADPDYRVRKDACWAFRDHPDRAPVIDPYRSPESAFDVSDLLILHDEVSAISLDLLAPIVERAMQDPSQRNDRAAVMAVVRTDSDAVSDWLEHACLRGSETARSALMFYYGVNAQDLPVVQPSPPTKWKSPEPDKPKRVRRRRAAPSVQTHPALQDPFAPASVLIVGGDGEQANYLSRLCPLGLEVTCQSGFGAFGRVEDRVCRADAVVLVWDSMSHTVWHKAMAALRKVGGVPWKYSDGHSVVRVAQALRSLLPA